MFVKYNLHAGLKRGHYVTVAARLSVFIAVDIVLSGIRITPTRTAQVARFAVDFFILHH